MRGQVEKGQATVLAIARENLDTLFWEMAKTVNVCWKKRYLSVKIVGWWLYRWSRTNTLGFKVEYFG